MSTSNLYLQFCSSGDPRYVHIRNEHYVAPKGAHAQQAHFLIWHNGSVVGIISGGSAAYAQARRDAFFGITKDNRARALNGIVDNTVFRLVTSEKNLATRTVALWRLAVAQVWKELYGVDVYGFETFVDGANEVTGLKRNGALYLADNWKYVGETAGSSKNHDADRLDFSQSNDDFELRVPKNVGGLTKPCQRSATTKKLVFCRWVPGHTKAIMQEYRSSWRLSTPDERRIAAVREEKRSALMRLCFFKVGNALQTGPAPGSSRQLVFDDLAA